MELDFVLRPGENLPISAHERMRAAGPVVWSETLNGWVVSSYETVKAVLSDLSRFTSAGTAVETTMGPEAMLVDDTPLHHKVRAIWTKAMAKSVFVARAKELTASASQLMEEARPRLEVGEAIDLVPIFQSFGTAFIASSFGVTTDRLGVFRRWSSMSADAPALNLVEGSAEQERHRTVKQEVFDLVREEIVDRRERLKRGEEPTDLIALMAAAEGSHGITRAMVVDNVFNFILGSMDTTERWLGLVVIHIFRDPELVAKLRADSSLLEATVDEVMRTETVAQVIMRVVKEDGVEFEGQRMNKGDDVFLMLGAASRDPDAYANADSFDIHRQQKPLLGFGFGFHHCLGIHAARQEVVSFAKVLLEHFPGLKIGDVDFGNNWALWGPRKLTVRL
jgi:pimeloyl-[acyl-carrier protein] synthase